jgi:hypothetical protein
MVAAAGPPPPQDGSKEVEMEMEADGAGLEAVPEMKQIPSVMARAVLSEFLLQDPDGERFVYNDLTKHTVWREELEERRTSFAWEARSERGPAPALFATSGWIYALEKGQSGAHCFFEVPCLQHNLRGDATAQWIKNHWPEFQKWLDHFGWSGDHLVENQGQLTRAHLRKDKVTKELVAPGASKRTRGDVMLEPEEALCSAAFSCLFFCASSRGKNTCKDKVDVHARRGLLAMLDQTFKDRVTDLSLRGSPDALAPGHPRALPVENLQVDVGTLNPVYSIGKPVVKATIQAAAEDGRGKDQVLLPDLLLGFVKCGVFGKTMSLQDRLRFSGLLLSIGYHYDIRALTTPGGVEKFSNTTQRALPEMTCRKKKRRMTVQKKVEIVERNGPSTRTPNELVSILLRNAPWMW